MALTGKKYDDLLSKEIRPRFDYAESEWSHIHKEADEDMQFVAGNPWTDDDEKQRKGRPTVAPDELHQYYNQVINDVRSNPRGIKCQPQGNGANDETAEFYQNKFREIEQRSKAQIVYTTAFQNTIHQSFGFCRVKTKKRPKSFVQDIWLEEFVNPKNVLPDPDAKRPNLSDQRYCFVREEWDVEECKRTFGDKMRITDFGGDLQRAYPSWAKGNKVTLAEYWSRDTYERELVEFKDPKTGALRAEWADDLAKLPEKVVILNRGMAEDTRVCQYLTNGVEVLEETEWPGQYIPIVGCMGMVLYINNKRTLLSMTRFMRQPWKLYCYYRSQQAEIAGMIPKAPVVGYEGQFRGHIAAWQKANHEPVAFLEARAKTEATGDNILPLPQRIDYPAGAHLQALEICAEGARRSIQSAAAASPLPTDAQRQNQKSGIALQRIEETGQKGSFHFIDHYNDMIEHVGVVIEDLIDKVHDTMQDISVVQPDGTASTVSINDPNNPDAIPTTGAHLVTLSTGPSFESERDAATDLINSLLSNEQIAPLIAADAMRLRNLGPIGEQIADNLEFLKPPELRKQKEGEQAQIPPEVQQALAEREAKLRELGGQLQAAMHQIEIDGAKQQATIEKARIDADKDIKLQELRNAGAVAVAEINARTKGVIAEFEAEHERLALHRTQQHDATMAAGDAVHEQHMAEQGHRQAQEAAATAEVMNVAHTDSE
jgi:hypothetical protein